MTPSLDSEIQYHWGLLTECGFARTFYLSDSGRLLVGRGSHLIGTFDSRVSLVDFRDEVFWCYEQLRRARRGR